MPERLARSRRLRDYFDLQLRFAETISGLAGSPIESVVARYTNFHLRLGLGRIGTVTESEQWRTFTQRLGSLSSHDERVEWTQRFYLHSSVEPPASNQSRFGCFGYEVPAPDGTIRIHFGNHDVEDGTGPLSSKKVARRTAELTRMFRHIAEHHPNATEIRGGSWLYNIEAYRRLFPPAYVRATTPPLANPRFDGTSSWGQFLDHREHVRADLRAVFLRNLERIDLDALWRAFPMPALFARALLAVFHEHYGTGPR